jgi:hypothetical protein
MRTISLRGQLAAGRVALVDCRDYELLSQYPWRVIEAARPGRMNGPYAATGHEAVLMHCLILGLKGVDHINHDGLDNRRSNLRPATRDQNNHNERPRSGSVSPFKGVTWDGRYRGRWQARIAIDGRRHSLGCFGTEAEAARAYDLAARCAWGEYAWLNFPDGGVDDDADPLSG